MITASLSRFCQLCSLALLASICSAEQTITSIQYIRSMMPSEVEGRVFAEIEGQVLCQQRAHHGLFLYDGENGIYVTHTEFKNVTSEIQAGDWVRVKGMVMPGGYSPYVIGDHVEIIGHGELPEPQTLTLDEKSLVSMDCQWVSVKGRLISVEVAVDERFVNATLENSGRVLHLMVPYSESEFEELRGLTFSEVRASAVVATSFNLKKQAIGWMFIVQSAAEIVPLEIEPKIGTAPLVPIAELLRKNTGSNEIVRTRGVVTGVSGKELFLRGESACLRVQLANVAEVNPGAYVEIVGYVWVQPISPAFRALSLESLGQKEVPEPLRIELEEPWGEEINYELVELDAYLIDVGKSFVGTNLEELTLPCRMGSQLIEAKLPGGWTELEGLAVGSKLRLKGIAFLSQNPYTVGEIRVDGLGLRLRGEQDVELLEGVPWWTPERALWFLGAFAAFIALVLVWVVLLRRTVDKQSRMLGEQVEREAVLNERHRIARELHDNLEQGLAGMAIQLRGCLRQLELNTDHLLHDLSDGELAERIRSGSETTEKSIAVVRDMLAYCSAESRSTILDLRDGLLERMDLASAIKRAVEPLAIECGADLDLSLENPTCDSDRRLERNLLLIVREAVSNAARHASPSRIMIKLASSKNCACLSVEDNGCGFDQRELVASSRFGIRGMRERVGQLKGSLSLESSVGSGTKVFVEIPLSKSSV